MSPSSRVARAGGMILLAGLAAAVFCADILQTLDNSGKWDWDLFFFHTGSTYRSVVEFGEPPLWNPWYRGGFPMIGNPQVPIPDGWFLLDLIVGPFRAVKFKIVGHYALGLLAMYWCVRQFQLSRLSAVLASGAYVFSTWLALHLHSGHFSFLPALHLPWAVGFLHRARTDVTQGIYAAGALALMIFGGGVHLVILSCVASGVLVTGWAIQDRSIRPLVALLIMVVGSSGATAFRVLPSISLNRAYPRMGKVGGSSWSVYQTADDGETAPAGDKEGATPGAVADFDPKSLKSLGRWELPVFLAKIFLGREQRSNTYYFRIQGFKWHEYGTYLGPFVVLLLALSPVFWRRGWPFMASGAFCFLIAIGNFSWWAPWTVLHRFPVFSNMRAPSRFLIPVAFVACLLAAIVFDALLRRVKERAASEGSRRRIEVAAWILAACALIDIFLVGRASLRGSFGEPPLKIGPPLPAIVTIVGENKHAAEAMYANNCALVNGEQIPYPIRVAPQGSPEYRGEIYFVPAESEVRSDGDSADSGEERVELESWSPNIVTVRVTTSRPGNVVLNRNWGPEWVAESPYEATSHEGLISAAVTPGEHRIRFAYRPKLFWIGLAISLVTLSTGITVLVWHNRRDRRPAS